MTCDHCGQPRQGGAPIVVTQRLGGNGKYCPPCAATIPDEEAGDGIGNARMTRRIIAGGGWRVDAENRYVRR
jgi:hypothetical protein